MYCSAPVLTPIALGRLAHPSHTWGAFHHAIQGHLLKLITGRLRHPDGRPCKRLMILTPPQHGKSSLTSQLLPPIAFAQNPATKLILLSYSSDLAQGHALRARDHVRQYGPLLNPALALAPQAQARRLWMTTAGGQMVAGSIQGTVTGLPANGILIDDPFKGSEDSSSPTIREKVWNTFSAAAETRLAPNGWICLINTPWHPDDLSGRLLETEPEKWTVLRFPALAEDAGDPLGRAPGEPLFPERYPPAWYAETKRTLELRGQGHLWDALYMCRPTGDASLRAFSDPAYFAPHIWADGLPETGRNPAVHRVLALDPAHAKAGKVGDYSAFADLTLMADRHVYAAMTLVREPLPALYATAVSLVRQARDEGRPYRALLIECNGAQTAIAHAIAEKLDQAELPIRIDLHTTSSRDEKNARIVTGLSPLLAQRRLHFVGQSIGNRLTLKQLQEIPNGAHDDGPDALEMGTQLINLLLTGAKRPPATILRAA